MTTDVQDFEAEVIEASRHRPVLVDFWAPWCGPCRQLGPVLEKLAAEESNEAWRLTKVNTDENQAIATRYRISSIPAVKLFVDGEVADEFIGALPERAVRDWLAKALPSETKQQLADAKEALAAGRRDEAIAALEALVAAYPADAEARLVLAGAVIFEEPTRARELISGLEGVDPSLTPMRNAALTILRFFDVTASRESLPEGTAKAAYAEAARLLSTGDLEAAIARLVEVVRLDRRLDNDGARLACVAIFTLLGDQHPLSRKGRQQLQMALF